MYTYIHMHIHMLVCCAFYASFYSYGLPALSLYYVSMCMCVGCVRFNYCLYVSMYVLLLFVALSDVFTCLCVVVGVFDMIYYGCVYTVDPQVQCSCMNLIKT